MPKSITFFSRGKTPIYVNYVIAHNTVGGPLGIWVIFLANWLGNRTYFGAGAPRGAPTEKGAVALSHFGFVRQLFFSFLQYAKDLKERRSANCGLRTASYPYCFLIGIML